MSDDTWILNPEWEHAQFVSISELRECERKLEVLNRGNANAEKILCELTGCESGRDIPDWIVKKNWELTDLANAYLELVHKHTLSEERIKRLEEAGDELLRDNDDMANINRWRKAKEAKP